MLHSGRPRSTQFLIQRGTHSCRLIERMWSDRAATAAQPRKDKAGLKKSAGGALTSSDGWVGGANTHVEPSSSVSPTKTFEGGICICTGEEYVQQATCKNHLKFQAETAPRVSFHLHPARQTPLRRAGKKKTVFFPLILPGGVSGRTCI